MKARPIRIIDGKCVDCEPHEATYVELKFPLEEVFIDYDYYGEIERAYPLLDRIIPVQIGGTRKDTGNWSWNGDTEKPTLKPSILTQTTYAGKSFRCHSFVNDGIVKFLSDCTHENAGKNIELMEIKS